LLGAATLVAAVGLAPAAWAEPPELGRCLRQPGPGEKYKTRKCSTLPAPPGTPHHIYEWLPGAGAKPRFVGHGKEATIEEVAPGTLKIVCRSIDESGEYVGTKSERQVVVTLRGCTSGSGPCGNAAANEIVTRPLEGAIGLKDTGLTRILLGLFPTGHSGPVAEFHCGTNAVTMTGALLGPLPIATGERTYEVRYVAREGRQNAEELEDESGLVLSLSVGGGPPVRAGLNAHPFLTSEELIQFNLFV
jgi:hypothetical protein